MCECRLQPESFQGKEGFEELGHIGPFSPRYSKNYILNGKCNGKMDIIRAFFQNWDTFMVGRPPLFSIDVHL